MKIKYKNMIKQPSQDWIEDCNEFYGKVLSGSNAHWCPDWDFLPIDDTCEEMKYCTCGKFTDEKPELLNKQ